MLGTTLLKATNVHQEALQAPLKGCGRLPLAGVCSARSYYFFFNYRNIKTPLTSRDNFKKTEVKKPKKPLDLRPKKD
jgi:hypothetical protein